MDAIETVMELCAAANACDLSRVLCLFTPDTIYHNMPVEPLRGIDGVRTVMEPFISKSEKIDWIVHRIAQAADGQVFVERTDRFLMGGEWMAVPVTGVFEVVDGKIVHWRDYYDQETIYAQMRTIGAQPTY